MSRRERVALLEQRLNREHAQHLLDVWHRQVPEAYQDFTVEEDIKNDLWQGRLSKQSARRVLKYLQNPTKFLILRGEEGLGKSTLAVTVASQLIESMRLYSEYRSTPILLRDFSFPGDSNPVAESIRPDMLLLDDVGARTERTTDHQQSCLWSVVNERYGRRRKYTIITTNMALNANVNGIGLAEWFGPSAWPRITSDYTLIEFEGDSFRG